MGDVSRRSLTCYDGTDPAIAAVAAAGSVLEGAAVVATVWEPIPPLDHGRPLDAYLSARSEEHTSELQSQSNLVCRLLLEKKNSRPGEPPAPCHWRPSPTLPARVRWHDPQTAH